MLVTVIGRGHSGTRAMSHTLTQSGVFMGDQINESGDLIPAHALYEACRIIAREVRWKGGLDWDFSALATADIPAEFEALVRTYLQSVLASPAEHRGWKLPETTLIFPWILRLFPEAKYIFWIRDPRDCILGRHLTDDLAWIDVPAPVVADDVLRRAISWQYQYNLVKATHPPANWIEVRFEDFVRQQDATLARLETFLGLPLVKIPVRVETVERWRSQPAATTYDFLAPALRNYGYELPAESKLQPTNLC